MKDRYRGLASEKIIVGTPDTQNQIEDFVADLQASKEKLGQPLKWEVSHNRRRTRRSMSDSTDQRSKQLREVERALTILQGDKATEVLVYKNDKGKIVGMTVDTDLHH